MNRRGCPRESEMLSAFCRRRVDVSIASHVASCAAEDLRPFPSAAVLRLEGELRREEQRLARGASVLLAAVRLL